ncbi:MAG: serine protease [Bauldia sp.]|nr:serine protease [Bauldia sp.]
MTTVLSDLSAALAALTEETAAKLVAVHGRPRVGASGIVLRDGLVVTAEEALERDEDVEVTLPDGSRKAAALVGRDPTTDVALLRVEGAPAATWTQATETTAGALALAVGRGVNGPLAALGVTSEIGGQWESLRGGTIDRRIRLNLRLEGRLEGGAVVDASGGIVGMAALGPRRRAIVIPIETVSRVAEQLAATGYIARGYLGVGLHPTREGGVIVVGVDESGPAKAAGLLLGDVLTEWNGTRIGSVEEIFARLGPGSVGEQVRLGILRGGKAASVELTIGQRPRS